MGKNIDRSGNFQDTATARRLPDASGSIPLLTQLFANLVENATRHCPGGAQIALIAAHSATGVSVAVRDNGPGIPADRREKVLQRFVRLDASRSTPGNGLGLSMAAAIASLHEADWQMTDNAPGLRITISFPVAGPA
jgi:signal transduction histidine kinase